ncbi:MAG TPA: hypothetical protein VG206_17815 [Terriglobia bacterium]|nr:hypothetical protein [Terriglobia bacterium]
MRDSRFVEVQRLKRASGPALWQEVGTAISEEGNALGHEIGRSVVTLGKTTSSAQIELLADMGSSVRRCKVEFDPETGKLTWATEGGSEGALELDLGIDGKLAFHARGIPQEPQSIARQIL